MRLKELVDHFDGIEQEMLFCWGCEDPCMLE